MGSPLDEYSSEAMDESLPATPLHGQFLAFGSEPTTGLGTPPASEADDTSMASEGAPSVYTFDSTADGPLVRELHGRTFNSTNQVYVLPADDEEQDRQDMQHRSLYHFVGGLFPWPERVEPLLAPSNTHRPAILDIGTGSGTWVLDMGRRYPNADVVGIDLVPPLIEVQNIPENCRFEVDDANLSMMHYASTFDFVHMRGVESGIHDFESWLYSIAQILKPGGEMMLTAGDYHPYNEHRQYMPVTEEGRPGFSWFTKYYSTFMDMWKRKGSNLDAPFHWEGWLRANPNFEDVKVWELWMPVGPWESNMTPDRIRASLLFRRSAIQMTRSCMAALIDDGYPREVVELWQRESEKEIVEMRSKLRCTTTAIRFTAIQISYRQIKPVYQSSRNDTDCAMGSPLGEYPPEAMDESPPATPLYGQALAFGSEPATRPETPPASEADDTSMASEGAPSVYTFDSAADGPLLRELHGRTFNSTNQAYMLPADDEEQDRHDMQHRSLYHFVGGLFPWPERVEPLLAPSNTHRPAILDIGTGSGTWVLDMGRRYPHADVVGIDLVPPLVEVQNIPENCRFEIDDANLPMMHYASTFDLVHMRAVVPGIHDFESWLYSIAQVLKPGGEMVLSEAFQPPTNNVLSLTLVKGTGDYPPYNEHRQHMPITGEGSPGFSWFVKYHSTFMDGWRRKSNLDAHLYWEEWLKANPNFEDVKVWELWMPIGPWEPNMTPDRTRASLLFRRSVVQMTQSCMAALIEDGYPKEVVERWQREAEKEVVEMRPKLYVKWNWAICRRTQQPWIPRHQVSSEGMSDDSPGGT
ncbi:hypothetical protein FRB99_004750 [Tulasnella sp. 403]|nr:hypothetical protein FRB99_004750 [Tulasnella sp. 403]